MDFAVVDTITNKIKRVGTTTVEDFAIQGSGPNELAVLRDPEVTDGTHEWDPVAEELVPLPAPTASEQHQEVVDVVRQARDNILNGCDWTVGTDSPFSASKIIEWKAYRQALRDFPAVVEADTSLTDYDSVVWPTPPA